MKDKTEIKIFVDDEESLKILGELLSNKTSRDLIKFLMNKSTYKKKIADELGIPFSLIEYHLKKLEKLGLVKITNKKLTKKGIFHKNYKISAEGIFITFNTKEMIREEGILKRIFREGVKFSAIGIVSIASYFLSFKEKVVVSDGYTTFSETRVPNEEGSFTISLVVIIIGLGIIYFLEKRKKRKN